MAATNYELKAKRYLSRIYDEVSTQWYSMKGTRTIYCPNLDVAVGPFAMDGRYENEYDMLLQRSDSKDFINKLIDKHNENILTSDPEAQITYYNDFFHFNSNARCFISIEVENRVSRKHLVGGLVNASALGRVAVIIGWDAGKLKALLKLRSYLLFLASVRKNTFRTNNILILSKKQFEECFTTIVT